jgi:Na+/H+ antiporter NhaD/arsenite permease-like protein
MDSLILLAFVATYLGMALGSVPGLRLERTGLALMAVVVLLASGAVEVSQLGRAIDLPTLLLLFALMIVSAQFGAAGFYDWVAAKLARAAGPPGRLLALVVVVAAGMSAILANDIIAFAMAPILAEGTRRRGLDPRPFLIALACACNAGSAMTVIGNPQNILIGQVGGLNFWRFLAVCGPAGLVSLGIVYGVVRWQWRAQLTAPPAQASLPPAPPPNPWQTAKGVVAVLAMAALFTTSLPRDIGALVIAALLLASRRLSSRDMIGAVDWHLLLLFACLFTVTGAFSSLGLAAEAVGWLSQHRMLPDSLIVMTPLVTLLSNTIGNVPAVILILSVWAHPPEGAMIGMALLSTLAGNLLIVGSLANIIVVERAATVGVKLSFRDHARSGIPVTLLSMAAAAAWLAATGAMPGH